MLPILSRLGFTSEWLLEALVWNMVASVGTIELFSMVRTTHDSSQWLQVSLVERNGSHLLWILGQMDLMSHRSQLQCFMASGKANYFKANFVVKSMI